ncbi:hypothetical protein ABZ470_17240 [Streptosporangium sp. NPDC020072]|uniref:hypothetical protein n=1 Tax=Streptosporangium sp. NPDC020072 TaxID=3154788 RepID=UPI00341ABF75
MYVHDHERPYAALSGEPPINRTFGSHYRVTLKQPPGPLDTFPQQLTTEDVVEPTS